MAHFAELDENNLVLRVMVVVNDRIKDHLGNESEEVGIAFCKKMFGKDTVWKQTSYNGNFRKRYASIGYTYDSERDVFLHPSPYPSWILNELTFEWKAPVDKPNDENYSYEWNELTRSWDATLLSNKYPKR